MRVEGLEPPRLAAPEPKSGVSTNSTTPAQFLYDSFKQCCCQPVYLVLEAHRGFEPQPRPLQGRAFATFANAPI